MFPNVPVLNAKPNAKEFIDILMGAKPSKRVPVIEYLVDDSVMKPIHETMLNRQWVSWTDQRADQKGYLDNFIEFWFRMGYDFVRFERPLPFQTHRLAGRDDTMTAGQQRKWADEHHGSIMSWADFEKYNWPRVEDYDFSAFEYINAHLPEGMGLITCHAGGIYEHLSMIMSYEGLSMALFEEPDLVRAVVDRVGGLLEQFYKHLLDLDRVIAIFPGDDMGFKTSTLISPDDLKEYCLPWHKKFAAMTHAKDLPYFLHSCGYVIPIMDTLINDVRIDGKHSYEDGIIPAPEFQKLYGDKIAVLGGMDVNILAAGAPGDVRKRARYLLESCGARGRFALGAGNSIPSYIPVENYLSMLDEAHAFNKSRSA